LRYGAVHAPSRTHLSPVDDVSLHDGCKAHIEYLLFLSLLK
jgi:hypothetical protein